MSYRRKITRGGGGNTTLMSEEDDGRECANYIVLFIDSLRSVQDVQNIGRYVTVLHIDLFSHSHY